MSNNANGGVIIFGATRGTGLEIARVLAARGDAVTAFVRPTSELADLDALEISTVNGDAVDAESVDAAVASGQYRAIAVSLGGRRGERPRPDLTGIRNIVAAAQRHGVRRVLLISAIGAGDSKAAVAPKVLEVLGEVLEIKAEVEQCLVESGLDMTILRPGGMTSDPASGTAIKSEDHMLMGVINRADLAQLTVDCLDDDATIGRIFHTIDPGIKQRAPLERGEDLPNK